MRKLTQTFVLALTILALVFPVTGLADMSAKGTGLQFDPTLTVGNDYIRILASDFGIVVVSTTGGDPSTAGDDNKRLLYSSSSTGTGASHTGTPTLRVISEGGTQDIELRDTLPSSGPRADGQSIVTEWEIAGVRVTQRVSLAPNPFTGRADMAKYSLTLTNITDATLDAGVRLMLDLMIGNNDYAPILVPDLGRLNTETELGDAALYRAFEAFDYAADSLRALGIVRGYGLTAPDRLAFCAWPSVDDAPWDYATTPGRNVGDSAMAYYWNPKPLDPGASVTYETLYGLGQGGGSTWFDAPASVSCDSGDFSATLWVSNNSPDVLTGGQTTLTLPVGLATADGATTLAFPDVPGDGVASLTINLVADISQQATYAYSAATTFEDQDTPFITEASIQVPDCTAPAPPQEVPEPGSLTLLALGLGGLAAAWRHRRAR